jgi:hypothetical protein
MNPEQRLTDLEAFVQRLTEMVGANSSRRTQPSHKPQRVPSQPPVFEKTTFLRKAIQNTAYTVGQGPEIIAYTALTAPYAVNLPPARSMPNRWVVIKDEAGTAAVNNITITPAGLETIDGAASVVINTNYGSRRVYSNGSAWFTA